MRRIQRCEHLEARYLLTGTGFPGNDCPPDLDLSGVAAQTATVGEMFTLDLGAMGVVTDLDSNGDPTGDVIRFVLDPDVPEETPLGAAITAEGLFTWTPTESQLGTHEIIVIAIDSGDPALADAETFSISVVEPVNAPPVLDLNGDDPGDGFSATLNEEDLLVAIVDTDLTITDDDNTMLSGATATITNVLDGNDEFLTVDVTGTNITQSYDPTTGILTLTGEDTVANYESVLRTLSYSNVADDLNPTQRVIEVAVNDGSDDSNTAIATVDIVPFNDAPDIAPIEDGEAFVGVEFEVMVTVTDPDSENITVTLDDESPASAMIEQVGDTDAWIITWTPTEADGEGPFTFRVLATDDGSPTQADSEVFEVTLGNPLAQADLNGAEEGVDFATSFTEGDGPIDAFADDATITDPTDTELEGATITLTDVPDGGDEVLTFDISGTAISGVYDAGVLTLTGTDTIENYEAVLRSVQYENLSENPTEGDRTIEVSLDDGTDFGPISTSTVTVAADNDAPELTLPGAFGDPTTPVEFTLGDMIAFTAEATDPDNDPTELTFMLDLDNSGITSGEAQPTIDQDGEFTWEPTETGTFVITIIVSDGLAADTETFTVQVNPDSMSLVNEPTSQTQSSASDDTTDIVMAASASGSIGHREVANMDRTDSLDEGGAEQSRTLSEDLSAHLTVSSESLYSPRAALSTSAPSFSEKSEVREETSAIELVFANLS